MNRLLSNISLSLMLVFSVVLFCNAADVEEAKEVLIKSGTAFSGEGAVISGPLVVQEIEKTSLEEISKHKDCPQVPFGFDNKKWKEFKSKYKKGDVILYFRTNNETWERMCGREGYMLIRDKEIIDRIFTLIN